MKHLRPVACLKVSLFIEIQILIWTQIAISCSSCLADFRVNLEPQISTALWATTGENLVVFIQKVLFSDRYWDNVRSLRSYGAWKCTDESTLGKAGVSDIFNVPWWVMLYHWFSSASSQRNVLTTRSNLFHGLIFYILWRNQGCWYLQWLQFYILPDWKNEVKCDLILCVSCNCHHEISVPLAWRLIICSEKITFSYQVLWRLWLFYLLILKTVNYLIYLLLRMLNLN